jgi:hypothetical protein
MKRFLQKTRSLVALLVGASLALASPTNAEDLADYSYHVNIGANRIELNPQKGYVTTLDGILDDREREVLFQCVDEQRGKNTHRSSNFAVNLQGVIVFKDSDGNGLYNKGEEIVIVGHGRGKCSTVRKTKITPQVQGITYSIKNSLERRNISGELEPPNNGGVVEERLFIQSEEDVFSLGVDANIPLGGKVYVEVKGRDFASYDLGKPFTLPTLKEVDFEEISLRIETTTKSGAEFRKYRVRTSYSGSFVGSQLEGLEGRRRTQALGRLGTTTGNASFAYEAAWSAKRFEDGRVHRKYHKAISLDARRLFTTYGQGRGDLQGFVGASQFMAVTDFLGWADPRAIKSESQRNDGHLIRMFGTECGGAIVGGELLNGDELDLEPGMSERELLGILYNLEGLTKMAYAESACHFSEGMSEREVEEKITEAYHEAGELFDRAYRSLQVYVEVKRGRSSDFEEDKLNPDKREDYLANRYFARIMEHRDKKGKLRQIMTEMEFDSDLPKDERYHLLSMVGAYHLGGRGVTVYEHEETLRGSPLGDSMLSRPTLPIVKDALGIK